jgi:hypothetical protein
VSRSQTRALERAACGVAVANPGTVADTRVVADAVRRVKRCAMVLGALLGVAALTACETAPPDYGAYENNLGAAGFVMRPANTSQRQAMLARLPQHRFVMRQNGNTTHYVYADSLVCDCLYVGTQQAFDQYKANQLQQRLIDQRQLIALSYADAAWSWDAWGPWGAVAPEFGFVYGPMGW